MSRSEIRRLCQTAPPEIDPDAILRAWQALEGRYMVEARRLARPVWARRGLPERGEQAWAALANDFCQPNPRRTFCIYIHIPFCSSKCDFCDCYSFRLGGHVEQHIQLYSDRLIEEMQRWSRLGDLAQRPLSTVHLGGGTPTFLGGRAFEQIVQNCRQCFNAQAQTEWALESTTSDLTEEMFALLERLAFTRLHLGIQSLEEPLRRLMGRRESGEAALAKISRAVALGWIVSVDLLYGLPGQSLHSLLEDIRRLAGLGVDGFSLYELQASHQNRRFIEQYHLEQASRLERYFNLQAAEQLLERLGYRKTLFNHFARQRDANLYFTFPERDEDCLALGTLADGVFGDYHYRHLEYSAYCKPESQAFSALQGGLRRSALESQLRTLEVALFSARFSAAPFADILGAAKTQQLFEQWQRTELICQENGSKRYQLTASGSWFIADMNADVERIYSADR